MLSGWAVCAYVRYLRGSQVCSSICLDGIPHAHAFRLPHPYTHRHHYLWCMGLRPRPAYPMQREAGLTYNRVLESRGEGRCVVIVHVASATDSMSCHAIMPWNIEALD
jgi:hypothetical protein